MQRYLITTFFLLLSIALTGYWLFSPNAPTADKTALTESIAYQLTPSHSFNIVQSAPGALELINRYPMLKLGEYRLSNGSTVIVKHREAATDSITLLAFANGGYASVPTEQQLAARLSGFLMEQLLLGEKQKNEMTDLLSYRQIEASVNINAFNRQITANCAPSHLDALLHFIHLLFTYEMPNKAIFDTHHTELEGLMIEHLSDPEKRFRNKFNEVNSQKHKLFRALRPELLNQIDYTQATSFLESAFGHPKDFTFFLVGDFHRDDLETLLKTQLATIPDSNHPHLTPFQEPISFPRHTIERSYSLGPAEEDAAVHVTFAMNLDSTHLHARILRFTTIALELAIRRSFMERFGESFDLAVEIEMPNHPDANPTWLTVIYDYSAPHEEALRTTLLKTVQNLNDKGVSSEIFEAAKQKLAQSHHFWLNTPTYWALILLRTLHWNDDLSMLLKAEDFINKMTEEDFHSFIRNSIDFDVHTYIKELPGNA